MKKIKFAKICINEWENASRDKRELSVVSEFNNIEIVVYAKGKKTGERDCVGGYDVVRISTRPFGNKIPCTINRIASVFIWANFIRKANIDIISGHNITALFIGYLSNVFRKKECKAKLIYDSHEFEMGRSTEHSKVLRWIILHLERFLMGKSEFSIMVNDSIAEEVKKIHNQKEKSVVVRNIPSYWELDNNEISETRRTILEKLEIKEDTFIVMYHGAVVMHRGADNMIRAISHLHDTVGIVLGDGESGYIEHLKKLAMEVSVDDRILFLPAVQLNELYKYVGAADVGTIMLQPVNKNHTFTLPNKFFENIQSMTPVIVSDFPDIGGIVDEFDIGLKVNPNEVTEISAAIKKLRDEPSLYNKYKDNLKIAKEQLCWENEKKILHEAYEKVIKRIIDEKSN